MFKFLCKRYSAIANKRRPVLISNPDDDFSSFFKAQNLANLGNIPKRREAVEQRKIRQVKDITRSVGNFKDLKTLEKPQEMTRGQDSSSGMKMEQGFLSFLEESPQRRNNMKVSKSEIMSVTDAVEQKDYFQEQKTKQKRSRKSKTSSPNNSPQHSQSAIASLFQTALQNPSPHSIKELISSIHSTKSTHSGSKLLKWITASPQITHAYIAHFYGGNLITFNLSSEVIQLLFRNILKGAHQYPQESSMAITDLMLFLTKSKVQESISPTIVSGLMMDIVYSAFTLETSRDLLSAVSIIAPKVTSVSLAGSEYFTKWCYLSVLDILEKSCSERQGALLVRGARLVENDGKWFVEGRLESFGASKWRGSTMVSITAEDGEKVMGIIDRNPDRLIVEVPFSEALRVNGGSHTRWDIRVVDFVGTLRSQLASLGAFVRPKKDFELYPYLMQEKHVEKVVKMRNLELQRFLEGNELNESQQNAIKGVLNDPLSLIQGPPGTGKTHTLAKLVSVLTRYRKKVLVVAPTNSAADNIMGFALKNGLNPIRTGDFEGTRPDMQPYMLQTIVPNPFDAYSATMSTLRGADLVVTTTSSANLPFLEKVGFDYLIMDEASQVTEPAALISIMVKPKHLILVGDHKQLPPSVSYLSSLEGYGESLFSRLSTTVEPHLLSTQYRSHPLIMSISNDLFYDGRLLDGVCANDRLPIPGFPWKKCPNGLVLPVAHIQVSDHSEGRDNSSYSNSSEVSKVVSIVSMLIKSGTPATDIGIISPYSGQNNLLRNSLRQNSLLEGLEINSVDAFQGREKEVIIFSATRSNSYGNIGFLSDPRRFNVMHTRAKRGLIVVGDRNTLINDQTWNRWFEWVDRHNLTVRF